MRIRSVKGLQMVFQRGGRLAAAVALLLLVACPQESATDGNGEAPDLEVPPQLSRPVVLPSIEAGEDCPFSGAVHLRGIPAEAGLGPGPVYPAFPGIPRLLDLFRTRRASGSGLWSTEILFVSARAYRGPTLIRGRRLDGPGRIHFIVGQELTDRLLLPAGRWPLEVQRANGWSADRIRPPQGWRVTSALVVIEKKGCYGFQVDTLDESYRIVFAAMPQPGARRYSL